MHAIDPGLLRADTLGVVVAAVVVLAVDIVVVDNTVVEDIVDETGAAVEIVEAESFGKGSVVVVEDTVVADIVVADSRSGSASAGPSGSRNAREPWR